MVQEGMKAAHSNVLNNCCRKYFKLLQIMSWSDKNINNYYWADNLREQMYLVLFLLFSILCDRFVWLC